MMRVVLSVLLVVLPTLGFGQGEGECEGRSGGHCDILVGVEWMEVSHHVLTTLMADPNPAKWKQAKPAIAGAREREEGGDLGPCDGGPQGGSTSLPRVAPRVGPESFSIDLRISPEQTRLLMLVEHAGWKTEVGLATLRKPHFERLRTVARVRVSDGASMMAGVVRRKEEPDKRMLVVLRCDFLKGRLSGQPQ